MIDECKARRVIPIVYDFLLIRAEFYDDQGRQVVQRLHRLQEISIRGLSIGDDDHASLLSLALIYVIFYYIFYFGSQKRMITISSEILQYPNSEHSSSPTHICYSESN